MVKLGMSSGCYLCASRVKPGKVGATIILENSTPKEGLKTAV